MKNSLVFKDYKLLHFSQGVGSILDIFSDPLTYKINQVSDAENLRRDAKQVASEMQDSLGKIANERTADR